MWLTKENMFGHDDTVHCTKLSSKNSIQKQIFHLPLQKPNLFTNLFFSLPLDAMLELALHKVALKPVYSHLYVCLKTAHREDGTLQCLEANKSTLENRSLEELEGAEGAGVPDSSMMEKIQQRWTAMHEAYSPSKKVESLLKVCKNIYHSMNVNAKPGE